MLVWSCGLAARQKENTRILPEVKSLPRDSRSVLDSCRNYFCSFGLVARFLLHLASSCGLLVILFFADTHPQTRSSFGLAERFLWQSCQFLWSCGKILVTSCQCLWSSGNSVYCWYPPPYKKFFWSCRKILVAILSVLVVLRQDSCGNLVSSCGLAARFLLPLASSFGLLVI